MAGAVIVVGSLNSDLVVGVERMPEPGETVLGTSLERHPGGKGLNQAVAAARLGATVAMVGAVGSDEAGAWLRDVAATEGIDTAHITTVDGPSGTAFIEVDDRGQNRIVVIPGANDVLDAEHVAHAIRELAARHGAAVVLMQGEIPLPAIDAALRVGNEVGATTILNPAPVREYPMLGLADIVVPNEHEAAQITGLETTTTVDATEAARTLVDRGARTAVITRGARGSLWSTGSAGGTVGAFRVVAIDTVAAGDAFCGGLAAAIAQGASLTDAMRRASAAGALAASRVGAVPSLPTLEELEALLESQG